MTEKVGKTPPFWETKTLDEMNKEEWESLCDGCAQCCQLKVKVAGRSKYVITPVVCKLLDTETCRCQSYAVRHQLVADCVKLAPDNVDSLNWLPDTCAYRLVDKGEPLYDWHPLIAGDSQMMIDLDISVANRAISERDIHPDDLTIQVIKWVEKSEG